MVPEAIKRGQPLPSWYLEEPASYPGDQFYLDAFWELSTCRSYGDGMGPIPWHFILLYAERHGLDVETERLFLQVIRGLDEAYLKWTVNERKRGEGKK